MVTIAVVFTDEVPTLIEVEIVAVFKLILFEFITFADIVDVVPLIDTFTVELPAIKLFAVKLPVICELPTAMV